MNGRVSERVRDIQDCSRFQKHVVRDRSKGVLRGETHCLSGPVFADRDSVYLTFRDNGRSAGQEGFLGP